MDQTTAPNLGIAAALSLHQTGYFVTDWSLRFEMRPAQRRVVSKIKAKFNTLDPGKY